MGNNRIRVLNVYLLARTTVAILLALLFALDIGPLLFFKYLGFSLLTSHIYPILFCLVFYYKDLEFDISLLSKAGIAEGDIVEFVQDSECIRGEIYRDGSRFFVIIMDGKRYRCHIKDLVDVARIDARHTF